MSREQELYEFVKEAHAGQKRIGGEDYIHHLERVAESSMGLQLGFEVGLCHDLLEDTNVTVDDLAKALSRIGYTKSLSDFGWLNTFELDVIVSSVIELTDEFTRDAYPNLKRRHRKTLESKRLSDCSYLAQSVKCYDIADNLASHESLDAGFLKVYLDEKSTTLKLMTNCYYRAKERAWFEWNKAQTHYLETTKTTSDHEPNKIKEK